MKKYEILNILDMIKAAEELKDDGKIDIDGEEFVREILSDFSCGKNPEIDRFIQNNAVDFANQKTSITYLVTDEDGNIPGIFALTHKAIEIRAKELSNTLKKKLNRYAKSENGSDYTIFAFLIAQFGKSNEADENFTGDVLMELAMNTLKRIQHDIGGGIVYLECEEKPQLLEFYNNNGFRVFGERFAKEENITYIQLLKTF